MTAAATTSTHYRPGRKATRPPVAVSAPRPLLRLVRPWWFTGWAAPVWGILAAAVGTWAAVLAPTLAPWAALVLLVVLATLARLAPTRRVLRAGGAASGALAAILASLTAPTVGTWGAVAIVATGGLLAAWPWFPMRATSAQRARLRMIRSAWPSAAERAGLPTGTALDAVKPTPRGWSLSVRAPRGADAGLIAHAARRLGSTLGRPEVSVSLDAADAGRAVVEVTEGADPLTGPPRPRPATPVATVAHGAPFGIDEAGRPIVLPLVESSGLIGGRPGAGKSVGLSLIAATAVEAVDAELWAIDLKRGVELKPWLPAATRAAKTDEAAAVLLAEAEQLMEARYDRMSDTDRRKITPSAAEPLIVLLADELAEMSDDNKDTLRRLVSLGRAAGVSVWAATQRPSAKLVPTDLRALFRLAIGFPTKRRRDSDVILGEGWAADGVDASALNAPGQCWAILDDGPKRCRTWLMTDADIGAVVARSAGGQHTAHGAPSTGLDHPDAPSSDAPAASEDDERTPDAPASLDAARLARHPGWQVAGKYAHAMHSHLLECTDSAAGTARAVSASDKTARRTLPRLAAVELVELRGGRWAALPATLDALEQLTADAEVSA
jgi:hypothetical protein